MKKILTLISQKEWSVAEKILGGYWQGHQKKNVSKLMIGAPEKSEKNNCDATKSLCSAKFCYQHRCAKGQPRICEVIKS